MLAARGRRNTAVVWAGVAVIVATTLALIGTDPHGPVEARGARRAARLRVGRIRTRRGRFRGRPRTKVQKQAPDQGQGVSP